MIQFFRFSGGLEGSSTGLTIDSGGALYGVAGGGTGNCFSVPCGVVFKLTPTQSGYITSILYNFQGPQDANTPSAPLTLDESTGAIYGTGQYGGTSNNGTVFKLTPSASGYSESFLYSFNYGGINNPDGFLPEASITLGPNGTLFGTAALGGHGCSGIGCGSVFELTPSGSSYTFKYIYDFDLPSAGSDPEHNGVVYDRTGGFLLGATRSGGSEINCYDGGPGGALGCGTVFKLQH